MLGMMTDKQLLELVSEVNRQRLKEYKRWESIRDDIKEPIPLTYSDVAVVLSTYARLRYVLEGDENDQR